MADRSRTARRATRTETGRLALVWGDPPTGQAQLRTVLIDEADPCRRVEVRLPTRRGGGTDLLALNCRRIVVRRGARPLRRTDATSIVDEAVRAASVVAAEPPAAALPAAAAAAPVTGRTPWLNVLCKFADIPDEPAPPSHVRDMFGTVYPGLAQYWAEVSYGQISIAGTRTLGWRRLPGSTAEYIDADGNPNLGLLFDHAVALIADVPVESYAGLNLFFNSGIGCCNWGTRWFATIGGVTRVWGVTWLPPSALRYIRVVAHEMGHGYGLPHSHEDIWDVMSIGTCELPSAVHHPRFGCVDVHPIGFHKDRLGWIPEDRKLRHTGGARTVVLERLAQPLTADLLLAEIPLPGSTSRFYTVESRRRAGYDRPIPGDGVVIHEVDLDRAEPARPVRNPARGDDLWLPLSGEDSFVDTEADVRITVHAASPNDTGFVVSIVAGPAIPTPPANLRLGAVTATSIEVIWDDTSDNESGFEVWWLPSGEMEWRVEGLPADVTSWAHTGLAPSDSVLYYVRACNDAGCSDWSSGVEATAATVPAPPANLHATAVRGDSITIAWEDRSDDEQLFQVWYTPAGLTEWTIIQVPSDTTTWTHAGLSTGESYSYWVQACNDAGCSDFSNGITATTAATAPAPPSDLRVLGLTSRSVELVWLDNATDETESQVWWRPITGEAWSIVSLGPDVTTWMHDTAAPDTEYVYFVRACNDAGCSDWSNAAVARTLRLQPPAAPSDLNIVAVTQDSIELSWQDNAVDETHVQVWHTPAGATAWTVERVDADAMRWTHAGLGPGMSFDYWVQACNETGCSDFSNGVRATTLAAARAIGGELLVPASPAGGAGRRPARPAGRVPPGGAPPGPRPAGMPPPADANTTA
jgi:hypothetical protein